MKTYLQAMEATEDGIPESDGAEQTLRSIAFYLAL